ncbi:hypothetical protein RBB79_16915 [Tunturiibacter empetritectus]|uniref:Uncharacterized protein n=1 Tax=Tunturiibacter lichenicola TaxID=2051959 RepID=A0A852VNY3_9BACT|nr:hypothetical protein [Edaphobacter lichenicola]NYF91306.1 hypothetical protein [Edaphobacter lichenicola]
MEPAILDVHPPHQAAHSWKDFFIHIATIVIGLLIAIGLEQTVEYFHHRHLLHQAEDNLHSEIQDNRQTLAADEKQLAETEHRMEDNLKILADLKAHRVPTEKFGLQWEWNGLQSAAWDTARNTGAIALMSYETAEDYSVIYSQQSLVNDQAWVYIRDVYKCGRPVATRKVEDLQPEEIDEAIVNSKQTLTDVHYLRDLMQSLNKIYQSEDKAL